MNPSAPSCCQAPQQSPTPTRPPTIATTTLPPPRCLAYRAADRFDVQQAAASPYLSFKRPERKLKENAAGNA